MDMSNPDLGDRLYNEVSTAQGFLFKLGEMTQLSYNAFELMISFTKESSEDKINIEYPLGLRPDGEEIVGERTYSKDDFIAHYAGLADFDLALNSVYQLVTIVETMIGDLVREILLQYPKKIASKRTIPFSAIFECSTLKAVHLMTISALMNELSYKSPREFAEAVCEIFGFNLLEIPAYHWFIEIKATRDVYIHDLGMANAVYQSKAGSHVRVRQGTTLPMNPQYFLQSYEYCLRLTEALMEKFHNIWPSGEYVKFLEKRQTSAGQGPVA